MTIGDIAFNGFDIVVLGVVLISLFMAAARGLARELISILALVIALAAALFIWGRFRFAAQDFIDPEWLADVALALGSFTIVYMIVIALMSGVKKGLLGKEVTAIGRLLGAAFGAGRGLIVMALAVMAYTAPYIAERDKLAEQEDIADKYGMSDADRQQLMDPSQSLPDWLESSTTYPILERIGDWIRALPFADVKAAADELRDGEIPSLNTEDEI